MKRGKKRKKLKRGRKAFKHLSSKEQLKQAKKRIKELGIKKKRRQFVYLICRVCKKEWRVHTNNKEIYTDEVRKNWACVLCKDIKRRYKNVKSI